MNIPWQLKVIGKIVLSRIPVSYQCWNRLGIFKHGGMRDPVYALDVFRKHFDRVNFSRKGGDFVILELGPGDSLYSAVIARAHGASCVHLVDTAAHATDNMEEYHRLASFLEGGGYSVDGIAAARTVDEVLSGCNARYHTSGLESLRRIPDGSVDFIWSQAVLEHVRRDEFLETMKELRRIMRDGGACSHRIDLKDHLGGGLDNLRFSNKTWESDLFAKSGFYTNRYRYNEMVRHFCDAGFEVDVINLDKWEQLPIRRELLSDEFAYTSDEVLLISGIDVVLKPV